MTKPLVISAPEPRSIDLIFTAENKDLLFSNYAIHEVDPKEVDHLDAEILARARYILG